MTVGIRTGDTTTKERSAQKKNNADLLISQTPEKLAIMLLPKGYANTFKDWLRSRNR